ncbi:hypothetical protein [Ruegeria meonggei]|uniref:hypothetical protein n=1 Tax=Ruegeria meonggei TaxID=1446476 RepID=UPI00117A54FD|nr:hypothetical protein [Ruegeria meonggei]
MTFTAWIHTVSGVITCIGIVLIIKSTFGKKRYLTKRGTTPSQNATFVASSYNGLNSDQGQAGPLPRDPHEYAKAMAPKE